MSIRRSDAQASSTSLQSLAGICPRCGNALHVRIEVRAVVSLRRAVCLTCETKRYRNPQRR